ncbi:hypothetical protein BD413DRAFT_578545 [Trametes elegans]|nr:hypothetical protein BD413DRAFT_578545 [Trametes elegans]
MDIAASGRSRTPDSPGHGNLAITGMQILSDCVALRGRATLIRLEGIVLHVKQCDGQAPEALSYKKASSRTIAVGRKSSQGDVPDDPERAQFRCPVVSRKHAKITFTEFGNVYITDLHSHHGTHILRPSELVSTALKPEVPTVLADGDVITFGKTVGRDDYLVRPVVVRVQLIFGRDASPRAPSPLPGSLTDDAPSPDKASAKSNTGRYGVYPHSSDSSPSTSDGDSDIQEISPPSSPAIHFSSADLLSAASAIRSGRLRILQSFLPPVHVSCESSRDVEGSSFTRQPEATVVEVEEEDMDLSTSRSASPMELQDVDVTLAGPPEEPPVIGAWPGSPFRPPVRSPAMLARTQWPESPPRQTLFLRTPSSESPSTPIEGGQRLSEAIMISDDEDVLSPQTSKEVAIADPVCEPSEEPQGDNADADMPQFVSLNDVFVGQAESTADVSVRVQELEPSDVIAVPSVDTAAAQTTEIINELAAIKDSREADEAAFSAHIQQTKDRLAALDGQMHDTQTRLSARDGQLSSIQTRLQGLGALMSDLQERSTLAEREASRIEELMNEVAAAKDMLKETCELQREARAQMAEELESVKALRAEAAAAVSEAKLAAAAAVEQTSSALKRKRDEFEEDARSAVGEDVANTRAIAPLPSKRRRTMEVVSKVAQTATAATVGAVAAWAALAFS